MIPKLALEPHQRGISPTQMVCFNVNLSSHLINVSLSDKVDLRSFILCLFVPLSRSETEIRGGTSRVIEQFIHPTAAVTLHTHRHIHSEQQDADES